MGYGKYLDGLVFVYDKVDMPVKVVYETQPLEVKFLYRSDTNTVTELKPAEDTADMISYALDVLCPT